MLHFHYRDGYDVEDPDWELLVVEYTFIPGTREAKSSGLYEFEANLVYAVSSRLGKATWCAPGLINTKSKDPGSDYALHPQYVKKMYKLLVEMQYNTITSASTSSVNYKVKYILTWPSNFSTAFIQEKWKSHVQSGLYVNIHSGRAVQHFSVNRERVWFAKMGVCVTFFRVMKLVSNLMLWVNLFVKLC